MSHTVWLMRVARLLAFVMVAGAASAIACSEHVYTGSDDLAVLAFDRNNVLADDAFTASQEFTEDALQKFFEKTPYGTRSVLADFTEGGEKASSMVLRLAVAHSINPIELLVRLQMERGLVEKATATDTDLSLAFNCGCPDGLVCETDGEMYTGFFNQAECTAKVFRQNYDFVATGSTTMNGWKIGEARTSEDGLSVTPATNATCVLYNYTPYVGEYGGGKIGTSGVAGYKTIRARFRAALRGEYETDGGTPDASTTADAGEVDAGSTCSPACRAPRGLCDTSGEAPRCVQCLNDTQCNNGICNLETNLCVECLPTRAEKCARERTGSVCLADNVCGCSQDNECGNTSSGRVCDATKKKCSSGCRPATSTLAAEGNTCPTGQTCLVIVGTSPDIGSCVRASGETPSAKPDAGKTRDNVDPPRVPPSTNGAPPLPRASAPGTQTIGGGEENVEVGNGPDKTRRVGPSCASAPVGAVSNVFGVMLAAITLVATRRRKR